MNSRGWETTDIVGDGTGALWLIGIFFAVVIIACAYNEIKSRRNR